MSNGLSVRYPISNGMKKIITIIILAVLVIGGVTYFDKKVDAPVQETEGTEAKKYENAKYGFSFEYPEGYVLTEREEVTQNPPDYSITLIREEDSAPRVDSEGPISINVNVYPNISSLGRNSLIEWLNEDNRSNYAIATNPYTTTTLADLPAVSYEWSGLYEGKSVAVKNGDHVVVFSRTRIDPSDPTVADFEKILQTVKFQ